MQHPKVSQTLCQRWLPMASMTSFPSQNVKYQIENCFLPLYFYCYLLNVKELTVNIAVIFSIRLFLIFLHFRYAVFPVQGLWKVLHTSVCRLYSQRLQESKHPHLPSVPKKIWERRFFKEPYEEITQEKECLNIL